VVDYFKGVGTKLQAKIEQPFQVGFVDVLKSKCVGKSEKRVPVSRRPASILQLWPWAISWFAAFPETFRISFNEDNTDTFPGMNIFQIPVVMDRSETWLSLLCKRNEGTDHHGNARNREDGQERPEDAIDGSSIWQISGGNHPAHLNRKHGARITQYHRKNREARKPECAAVAE
jgi:hypothetical protein